MWAVNHLGHFYLTHLLWDKIKKSDKFRIVNVSSLAHLFKKGISGKTDLDWDNINFDRNYDFELAYGRSKLYNVLFTRALAEKVDSSKGIITSLHPGLVRTELGR